MQDNMGEKVPIGFPTKVDALRARDGIRAANRNIIAGPPAAALPPNLAKSTECHIKITGVYNSDAKGYPAIFTFRNLLGTGSDPKWIDGEACMAFDINDKTLVVGKRYKGQVYELVPWDNGDPQNSIFVAVNAPVLSSGNGEITSCRQVFGSIRPFSRWLLTIEERDGSCSCVDKSQTSILNANASLPAIGDSTILFCSDVEYTPYLNFVSSTCGPCPQFYVLSDASGASPIYFSKMDCGVDGNGSIYIEFSSTDPELCTNDPPAACSQNSVLVRLTCYNQMVTAWCCDPDVSIPGVLYVQGFDGGSNAIVNLPVYFFGGGGGSPLQYYGVWAVPSHPTCNLVVAVELCNGPGGALSWDLTIVPTSFPNPFCPYGCDASGTFDCDTLVFTQTGGSCATTILTVDPI